jgi:hypothetical protein
MNLFLPVPNFTMELRGHWDTGGVLELYFEGERFACIKFSRGPWSVLATLFLAAIRAQSTHWFNAYVTTKDLVQSLQTQGVLDMPLPNNIHRLINKIRSELAKIAPRKLMDNSAQSEFEWAAQLIESSKGPGYRVALPPASLKLFIGETEYGAGGDERC